jgi:hypothetical protein
VAPFWALAEGQAAALAGRAGGRAAPFRRYASAHIERLGAAAPSR